MKILAMLVLGMSLLFCGVDINSASAEELTTLKGIGSKKAQAIVTYRDGHCFKNVGEIVNVKGIGTKFLEKNREYLVAGQCH